MGSGHETPAGEASPHCSKHHKALKRGLPTTKPLQVSHETIYQTLCDAAQLSPGAVLVADALRQHHGETSAESARQAWAGRESGWSAASPSMSVRQILKAASCRATGKAI
jgi:hypothetical protein